MGALNIKFLDTKRFSGIIMENIGFFTPSSLGIIRCPSGNYQLFVNAFDLYGNLIATFTTSHVSKRLAMRVYRQLSDKLYSCNL